MSLTDFLPMTLAGETPSVTLMELDNGVSVRWLAEGVLRIDPAEAGARHLLLSAGIHGNETAPVEWLDRLLRAIVVGVTVPRHPLLLVLGNPPALRAGRRYGERDLNRLFNGAHQGVAGYEASRAALLEQQAEAFFKGAFQGLHLDLHTAIRGSRFEKFALCPWKSGRQSARAISHQAFRWLAATGMQALVMHDRPGHTFSAFTFETLGIESFTLELGKARPFGNNAAINLDALGHAVAALLEDRPLPESDAWPLRLRVADSLVKRSDAFELNVPGPVENFQPLARGSQVARDGEHCWRVEHDRAFILFPNANVAIGQRAGLIVVQDDAGTPVICAESGAAKNSQVHQRR